MNRKKLLKDLKFSQNMINIFEDYAYKMDNYLSNPVNNSNCPQEILTFYNELSDSLISLVKEYKK